LSIKGEKKKEERFEKRKFNDGIGRNQNHMSPLQRAVAICEELKPYERRDLNKEEGETQIKGRSLRREETGGERDERVEKKKEDMILTLAKGDHLPGERGAGGKRNCGGEEKS